MEYIVVKVAKGSSNEQYEKISHMPVEKTDNVLLTNVSETDVNTAATRNVWPVG